MGEILLRKEVAARYKIPIRTIDYFVATGQIPFSRLGKRAVRFDSDRLDQWFAEREGIEYRHSKKN